MITLLIFNQVDCHYEIIESLIVKCKEILHISREIEIEITLFIIKNTSFIRYIKEKHPNIILKTKDFCKKNIDKSVEWNKSHSLKNTYQLYNIDLQKYDYYINCTIYDVDFDYLETDVASNKKYICHTITNRLMSNSNVWFLTPLARNNILTANILPFSDKKKNSNIPIYIIQGRTKTRKLSLLKEILDNKYKYKFIIKLIGSGKFPETLNKYKKQIIFKNNLNFIDYHKEFLDAYCILPLITKKTQPEYYKNKLTSTINYASGYRLKCIIQQDLQDIYKLPDVEIYKHNKDIVSAFKKTLQNFYK